MKNIKAVIFDWGGVLIEDPTPALMQYCADELNVSCADYTRAHRKFADDFQLGKISEDDFFSAVCNCLNVPPPSTGCLWGRVFTAVYRPKEDVFKLTGTLRKKGLLTCILSNTEPPAAEYFDRQKYDMFDLAVFSCRQGLKKPDERIFKETVKQLGVAAPEAVFVDDRAENIDAAKKVGLVGILFVGVEDLSSELSRLGIGV